MGRERDGWWRECRVCERWFFRLVVPLFLAAAVVGWLWSMTHAGQLPGYCAEGSRQALDAAGQLAGCSPQGQTVTIPTPRGVQLGSTTVLHYRCHRGADDVVVFEPIERTTDEPLVIFLHCVNCICEGEK